MIKLDNLPVLNIKVDNRELDSQSLFVAIVGSRFNPLEHLQKVAESGCKYVMCERSQEELTKDFQNDINFIFVEDIVKSIQELGHKVAIQFKERGGQIIAISGSNGKTTTKEMLFHLLDQNFSDQVICTQKNNNNHLGVPFSLFQIREETKFAIIELGSNHPGEIETLCKIAVPQVGITTNIGATHLEFFDTLENVYKEESVLGHYCDLFFQNTDDQFIKNFETTAEVKTFGVDAPDYKFDLKKQSVLVNGVELKNDAITGKHNFINLAVSFIIANSICPERNFVEAAASFQPTANRSQWVKWHGAEVFLDAYNANPSSMVVAVDGFVDKIEESACVILGDMNELGSGSKEYHRELGAYLRRYPNLKKIFIGRFASDYALGLDEECECYDSVDAARRELKKLPEVTNYILIKGSRSLQLESILDI